MSGRSVITGLGVLTVAAALVAGATAGIEATSAGGSYKLVGKWGKDGAANGQFRGANGIAVDRAGNVYVADTENHRIQVFSAGGAFRRKWGSEGDGPGEFNSPEDVNIGPDGSVWVADQGNGRLKSFSSAGALRTSLAADAQEVPRGVAVDASGNVFAAADGEQRSGIRRYDKTGTGWSEPGQLFGVATYRPEDVEASPDGSMYLVSSTSSGDQPRVHRFSAAGKPLGSFRLTSSSQRGIGVDLDCNVWAADIPNRRIVKYSPTGRVLASAAVADLIASDIAVGPRGDVYAIAQSAGIVRFGEDRSKPATANVPGTLTATRGVVRIAYTLSGIACPAVVGATATLSGPGIAGTAAGLKVRAGARNTIQMKLSKAASGKATFRIVLKTNGRPTTQTRGVTLVVR